MSTNGASLEDCHTNVFVLTELNGLKWKKFTCGQGSARGCTEIGEDAVLRAYGRCLSDNMLCAWRRVPGGGHGYQGNLTHKIELRLDAEKELWVFWYAEEPDNLESFTKTLNSPEEARGNYAQSGIEYETRTLLFKALHNLVERRLLSKGFVRLGKWFTHPHDTPTNEAEQASKSDVVAFNFSFFVHGENSVCVSVNTQRQPAVFHLSKRHLTSEQKQNVILAPWSLKAQLISNPESPLSAGDRYWTEWAQFYPVLGADDNTENLGYVDPVEKERQERAKAAALPKMVLVEVAGVRMFYPTCYVAVVGSEDVLLLSQQNQQQQSTASHPSPLKDGKGPTKRRAEEMPSDGDDLGLLHGRVVSGARILQRAVEEINLMRRTPNGQSPSGDATPVEPGDDNLLRWNIVDCCKKDVCPCRLPTGLVASKAAHKFGVAGQAPSKQTKLTRNAAFHRRSPLTIRSEPPTPPVMGGDDLHESVRTPASARPGSVKPPLSATMSGGQQQPHSVSYAPLSVSSQSTVSYPPPSYQNISPVALSRTQSPMVDDGVARSFLPDARLPPVNAALRKPSIIPPRALKRPKLDELDLFQLGLNVKEQLAHNVLLGQNYDARPPWCDMPDDDDDDDDEVNIVAEVVQAPVTSSSLPGLIEIRSEANPVARETTILQQMLQADDDEPPVAKATAVGDQKPTFTAASDLQPSVAMPDNFLETSPTVSHGILSSTSTLSPPASNERVDHPTSMPAPALPPATSGTSSTQPQQQFRTTGPPSVGTEYNKIYPTPPSIEAFHPQQFSPQNLLLQQHNTLVTETVSIASPADFAPDSTTRSTTATPLVVVPRPQTAVYLTSSKFFGANCLKGRASSVTTTNLSALKYNPSPQTKLSIEATTPPAHPMIPQTSHLIQQPSASIFPTQHQQQQQMLYGRQTSHFGGGLSQQQPSLHQTHFGATQQPQQSHLSGLMHLSQVPSHLNNASPSQQPFGGIGAPMIQRHPSFPPQGSPYGVQPISANPRTPGSSQPPQLVDIQSPLSNASSYIRGVNSVEAAPGGSCSVGAGARMPEAHGLVVVLLMSDTVADLHYDTSFDSCPICSCNSNIRGVELGLYLTPPDCPPNPHGGFSVGQSQQPRCTCGFSAVRHRFLSVQAGLFNEDQWEATGVCAPVSPRRPLFEERIASDRKLIDLVRQQTLIRDLAPLITSPIALAAQCVLATKEMSLGLDMTQPFDYTLSGPETTELNGMCNLAMEAACMVMDCTTPSRNDYSRGGAYKQPPYMHDWGLQRATGTAEPNDAEWLATLNELLPVLQELSHLPANVVQGPLTWRALERKSGKGTLDDEGRPEPVPQILVSMERDPLAVSPQTLRLWERLMLEPYDQPKDVVYVGVVPDNAVVVDRAKIFFSELSKTYENCRFGRHLKFSKGNGDGLIRVGSRNVRQDDRVDDWFTAVDAQMENKALAAKLRAYAILCENLLGPLLENENVFDRQVFKDVLIRENQQPLRSNESMPPPPTPGGTADAPVDGASTSASTEGQCVDPEVNTDLPHVVVVYLVNPFIFGADTHDEQTTRYCTVALLKAFLGLLKRVDKKRRPFVQLEIVQLQTVFDCTATINDEVKDDRGFVVPFDAGVAERRFSQRLSATDTLKSLALSVYTQTRQVLPDCIMTLQAKSMTGFGPAAATREIINKLDSQPSPSVYKIYCTPCVLAPNTWQKPTGGKDGAGGALLLGAPTKEEAVLFISYCLMEQRWLVATATDHQGHMLENCLINLDYMANQQGNVKFKAGSLIRDTLDRLWQFIMGALSMGCRNWRLVIGRVGRLGHGELKAWAQMLGRPNLKRYSQTLKEHCSQCQLMPGFHETPSLLSACLVSIEPEPSVRVFSSSVVHDDRLQGAKPPKHRPLRTPEDASCTHILVYPTSAFLSLSEHGTGPAGLASGLEDQDDFGLLENFGLQADDDNEFKDILGDHSDIFNDMPSSAALTSAGPNVARGISVFFNSPDQTDTTMIDNQPLATGFYMSTAPAAGLPDWFWSTCPAAKRRCPVHLKSSLHLHSPHVQQSDELAFGGSSKALGSQQHPLDSTRTDDALKYVLETYNSLSWLNVDLVTGERRSCLPVHIQALLRLYNSVQRLL